ncbi:MAG: endolytic transglycosylase MltG [Desulfobacterales bacterium]|nr:endolytic transglycosylase MltG [Desulfobacterales bacterium]
MEKKSPQPKTAPRSKWKSALIFLLTSLGLVLALSFLGARQFLTTPVQPQRTTTRFVIPSGENLTGIALQLKEQELISNAFFFGLYARYQGAAASLQAGEYLFDAPHTPVEILSILKKGKVKLYRITLPEGLNMKETAAVVDRSGFCDKTDFLRLCTDADFIRELGIASHSLEGYLYPDTYFFPITADCRQIISKMVESLDRVYGNEWKKRGTELGFNRQEVLTLASIIEKETGKAFERPLISSVFHNRIHKGMKLQSDPTVIYGDPNFKGRIRTRHLRRKTPYNTYVIKGLPLGPIANPGAAAIEAALYPDKSDFLFFVSKNDRTHKFSKTLKEHNRAVRKYQLNR